MFPFSSRERHRMSSTGHIEDSQTVLLAGLLWVYRYRDSNPGFRRERAAS
jgi:hypothetical protein